MSILRPVFLTALSMSLVACSSSSDGSKTGDISGTGSTGHNSTSGAASSQGRDDAGTLSTGGVGSSSGQPSNGSGGSAANGGGGSGAQPANGSGGQGARQPGSGAAAGEASCVEIESQTTRIVEEALPPILEFMIDVTGSMDDAAYPDDSQNDVSKWNEMQRVLPTAFAGLPSDWAVGVSYFNKQDDCYEPRQAVPIAPLSPDQLTDIDDSIRSQRTGGYTPTLAAWRFALEQVNGWEAPTEYAESPRYVVLITDGVPTVTRDGCSIQNPIQQAEYDYLVESVKAEGEAAGVQTFVVGVLGSEDPQGATYDPLYMLSQVATAGGTAQPEDCVAVSGTVSTPVSDRRGAGANALETRGTYCHFDMTADPDFASGLLGALEAIAEQVETVVPMSCSYEVPAPPEGFFLDPSKITVSYTSSADAMRDLSQSTDDSCESGEWFISATDGFGLPTTIELCPDTCSAAQQDPGASVALSFGCVLPM